MYDYHSERNGSLDVRRTQVGMSNTSNQYVEPGKGLMFTVTGGTVTRKMSGEEVGLPYSLYEVVSEVGTGPRPHIHHGQDEAYYVLAGTAEFLMGEKKMTVTAGTYFNIPNGTVHAYTIVGAEACKMLIVLTPPGQLEHFWEEIDQLMKDVTVSASARAEKIKEIAAQHNLEFVS